MARKTESANTQEEVLWMQRHTGVSRKGLLHNTMPLWREKGAKKGRDTHTVGQRTGARVAENSVPE